MELQFLFTKATSWTWPCACVKGFITVWSWQLLAKKTHQGRISTISGTNSFHLSRLSQHHSLLAHGTGRASKGAGSTWSEGRGLPGLCSVQSPLWHFIFLFPFWVCCQSGLSDTPTKSRFKRELDSCGDPICGNKCGVCWDVSARERLCDGRGGGKCLGNVAETEGSKFGYGFICLESWLNTPVDFGQRMW